MATPTQQDSERRFLLRAERWLRALVVVTSAFVMLLFVITALRRVRYPYELEELEGYVFLSALRVFHHQPVYVAPSLAFTPYMYPPLYYWVTAALGRVMGMSIETMRVTSILSTLGCFGAIFALVRSETRRVLPAIAAAGLYAGCYTVCQEWFDLGRLDSLFVLLVLLALLATRRSHPVLAACVWTLAFLTKQSILPVAFVMLACDWRNVRRTVSGLVALAITAGGSVLWLDHATHGWFRYYVFTVPGANADISPRTLAMFWPQLLLRPLLLTLMVILAAAVLTRPSLRSQATRFYLAACSIVPVFWVVDAHGGSTANAPMPVYALAAVLFGIAVARLLAWMPVAAKEHAQAGACLLLFAVMAQVAAGIYNPGDYVPPVGARASQAAVVATVKNLPGEVWVLRHPYDALLAGKPVQADLVSMQDAMRPADAATRAALQSEVLKALTTPRFSAVLLDGPNEYDGLDRIAGSSAWHGPHGYDANEWRIEGADVVTRPDWVLSHCPQSAADCDGSAR